MKRNKRDHKNDNGGKRRVIIPEVMTDFVNKPDATSPSTSVAFNSMSDAGFLPAERVRLREELGALKTRIVAANDQIIKTVTREAEFLEEIQRQADVNYQKTVQYHRDLGT